MMVMWIHLMEIIIIGDVAQLVMVADIIQMCPVDVYVKMKV